MGSRLEIVSKGPVGAGAVVRLDGEEIQRALRGLSLTMDAAEPTTAELDVVVAEMTEVDAEVQAYIPEATRDLLIRLGWTPPGDDASESA